MFILVHQEPFIPDFLDSAVPLHPATAGASDAAQPAGELGLHQEILEIYELHSPSLLRFARMMAGQEDGSLAQDAVQEVFFSYFLSRRNGDVVDNPRKWLHQRLKDHLERVLARSQRDESVAANTQLGSRAMPEMLFDVQRRLPRLLSPRELQAMRLRAEGFRYVEIAEKLSVTVGTVGTMIARA
ncbi:MAG: sigma-70 family RNA polymerase sigma factor, partial [Bryobacterales bacterium]|nr:sigma-70 family RNA polymerase sigma factor [Bryobacterales bacterium]